MTAIVKIQISHRARVCALALALHLTSPMAFAQYNNMFSSGLGYNTPSMAYAAMVQQQMQQNAYFQSQLTAKAQPAPSATTGTTPLLRPAPHVFKYPLSATDFTPSRKRNTPEQFTANAKTPQERAQVADMCRTILRTMEAQPGLRKNNLATALTVLLGISMQVSTGREFTDPESEGLQRTINDVLVDTASHQALSNEKRTAVYDALMITGGLIAAMAQNATESGNAAELQRATDLARQSVAMFMR